MLDLTAARGLIRSLRTYRRRAHLASLTQFCGEVAPGAGLVFDVGAHVGDRVTAFRRNGARVIAVEPQPMLARTLRALFALDRGVVVVQSALGSHDGQAELSINRANPTVSTLSGDFIRAADGAVGWAGQDWDTTRRVALMTLDALIARHGMPDFIKIDTEGHEAEVLRGLTHPVPALSFEITTIARDMGLRALEECFRLGFRRFRLSLGESHAWHTDWQDTDAMAETLRVLPDEANSGDVLAVRENAPPGVPRRPSGSP